MAKLDQKLLEKLANKLRKPTKYVKEQVSKKASKNNVQSEAYLVKWAKDVGIGCQTYFNRLDPNIKRQVSDLASAQNILSRSKQMSVKRSGKKQSRTKGMSIRPSGRLITNTMLKEAESNSNFYPELYVFENSLREFVKIVLNKKFGTNWWDTKVKKDIRDKVTSRMRKETMNPWHGNRGIHPLNYTDFSELINILRANEVQFRSFFTEVPNGLNWITQKLDEIYHSRNNIAHCSPLKKQDTMRFKTYFEDWVRQLVRIERSL